MNIIDQNILNMSIGEFMTKDKKLRYKDVENLVRENTIFGEIALNLYDKYAKFIFKKVDGVPLNLPDYNRNKTNTIYRRKDGYIDKQELYEAVKISYWCRNEKRLNDINISKISLKDGLKIIAGHFFERHKDITSDRYL